MNFSNRFSEAIKNKGISKAELARRIAKRAGTKVRGQQVNDWLKGLYKPSGSNLTAICYILEVPQDWLLTGHETTPRNTGHFKDDKAGMGKASESASHKENQVADSSGHMDNMIHFPTPEELRQMKYADELIAMLKQDNARQKARIDKLEARIAELEGNDGQDGKEKKRKKHNE
jgi:transcriptional regulator with XRE-family HTH domain